MKTGETSQFIDMEVWRDAQDLAVAVYGDVFELRDFFFSDQIKRAAVPISNKVAEGAERGSNVDFARFLDVVRGARRRPAGSAGPEGVSILGALWAVCEHIAKGSCGEGRSMYLLAVRLGYVDEQTVKVRVSSCESISRQLSGFAKYLRTNSGSP